MDLKYDLYTGTLTYRDVDFTFVFDQKELRLIPPVDKQHIIEHEWKLKEFTKGAYVPADPIVVEDDYLVGMCNETNHKIVFLPQKGSYLSFCNAVVLIELTAYVICKSNRDLIDRIEFSCPEINYIHPVNQAIELTIDPLDYSGKGIAAISTPSFDVTTTEKQMFCVDGKEVRSFFAISRTISTKIHEPPLSLNAALMFEFDATDNYGFILRLWQIARDFIRFLCYRKNVFIPSAGLSAPYEGEKHERFATMFLVRQNGKTEQDALQKGRYIKQIYISGNEGIILKDVATESIYLRHLPESYRLGRHIDAARFVMIMAAFEWEFRRLYPEGVRKTDTKIEVERIVSEEIENQLQAAHGEKRRIYKFLRGLVKSDSLQSEIIQTGKDFSDIIGVFGDRLYSMNGQKLEYNEMGRRLADQRNHFAHGDLDKEFIGLSLLDLIYMEYIVYAMQLKYYGVEKIAIQKAINELFHLNFAL